LVKWLENELASGLDRLVRAVVSCECWPSVV